MLSAVVCFDVQMMQVCIELLPSCPLLLLSKPSEDEDVVLGIAYIPKVSLLSFVFVVATMCCVYNYHLWCEGGTVFSCVCS